MPGPFRDRPASALPRGRAVLSWAIALLLAACASLPPGFVPPAGGGQVEGVPFHAQEDHQCGPASLAGVLGFLGDPATPEEIAAAVFRPGLRGSVSLDLALYPRSRGLASRFFRGAPADLLAAVDAGRPLVLMLDQGLGPIHSFHFVVLTGYRPEGVVLNSGRSRGLLAPWASFLASWAGADNWALEVVRP